MKLSVRWSIILGSIVLVWGTHIIITPSSYLTTKGVLREHLQDIMVNISDLTLEQANNHLDKAKSAAYLAKMLISSNVVSDDIRGSSSLERYLFNQLSIYPHLSGIYVGGSNGNFFMVSKHDKYQPDGFRTKVIRNDERYRSVDLTFRSPDYEQIASEQDPNDTYDPRVRPWFKKVMEHKHVIWTDPYIFFTAQKPGVTIAGPSFDESGNLKAIVGVDIEIAELSTFISKLRVGKTGKAFILHRNGDVIAYHDMDKLVIEKEEGGGLRLPKIRELKDIVTRQSFNSVDWQYDAGGQLILHEPESAKFEYQGNVYLSMFTPFPEPELPWIIGVFVPEDDYLAEIKGNQIFNLIVTFIITILASVLGLVLAKKIINPVVMLAEGAKDVAQHDIATPFHVHSVFKEIQDTADSFSRMKIALVDYEKQLHDKEEIYRAITSTANDAIILMNYELEIDYFNPAAEKMFGYTSQEVIGRKLLDVLAHENQEEEYKHRIILYMQDENDRSNNRTVEVVAKTKNNEEIEVELSLSKLKRNDILYAVAIIRDISDRKKASQLRKRLVNDLHDGIGGTLSNIKLLAEMTKSHKAVSSQTAKNLNAIAEKSEDGISEIQNYINVLDNPELSWQDFVAELHRYSAKTLELYDMGFSSEVEIDNKAPHPTTLLYMNVFKILKEALNNVIKHSNGDRVLFEVLIAESQAQFIFKDNGSEKDSPADSGRGLISMKSRIKELGGTIEFRKENGFRIFMTIPFNQMTVRKQLNGDEDMKVR